MTAERIIEPTEAAVAECATALTEAVLAATDGRDFVDAVPFRCHGYICARIFMADGTAITIEFVDLLGGWRVMGGEEGDAIWRDHQGGAK